MSSTSLGNFCLAWGTRWSEDKSSVFKQYLSSYKKTEEHKKCLVIQTGINYMENIKDEEVVTPQ